MSEGPWQLRLSGPAVRDIERLPEKYATAVVEMLSALVQNPMRMGKPLRFELEGSWSARRGTYRVIYRLDEVKHVVEIVAVAHRADVYRPR